MKTYSLLVAVLAAWGAGAAHPTRAQGLPAPQPAKIVADLRGDDGAGVWDYAAIDPAGGHLLIGRMSGVQTVSLAGLARGPMLAAGQHVHAVVPLPGGRVLFTNGDSNTASVVDGRTGALLGVLPTGRKPDGGIYDPALGQVLVMNGNDGTITRINVRPRVPELAGRITVGGKLETPALGAHDRLFVNVEDRNALAIISLKAGQLERQVTLEGCDAPTGLAYDEGSRRLVSACENGVAGILDEDGRMLATLPIGRHPDAAIGDPAHHRVFVPGGGDGTLTEIALDGTPRVTRVWLTRPGARTGAYDLATQRVYLPYGEIIRETGQPPRLKPGSFGVLVMDVR